MISITTVKKIVTCHRLYCGHYWNYESGLFEETGKFVSFEEINEIQILYNDRSSARQFVRWLKEVLDVTVPNEVVLNNKDTEGLLKRLSESIEADEVVLLTKLCSLYERMMACIPALVVDEVESSLNYKLKEVFEEIN